MWRLSTAGYIPMVSNPYYLSAGGSVEQDSTRNVSNTGHLCLHYYFFARLPSVSKISKHLDTLPTPFFYSRKRTNYFNFSKNIKRTPNKQTISCVTEFKLLYLQIKSSLRKSWLYLFGSFCLLKIYNMEKKESTYWKSFNERVLIVTKYRITLLQTEYVKIFCWSFEWESL